MPQPRHIVFVGPMGVGKTTVGSRLAAEIGWPFVDSDAVIEASGRNAATLAGTEGVPALHRREVEVVLDALAAPTPSVIAAAASVVDDAAVRAALHPHVVVWLQGSPELVAARAGGAHHRRTLGDDPVAAAAALERERAPHNREVADVTVGVDGRTPDDVRHAVRAALSPFG